MGDRLGIPSVVGFSFSSFKSLARAIFWHIYFSGSLGHSYMYVLMSTVHYMTRLAMGVDSLDYILMYAYNPADVPISCDIKSNCMMRNLSAMRWSFDASLEM